MLLPNKGHGIGICDEGVAPVFVILVRIVQSSEDVLQGSGHSTETMVLEHRHVDHGRAVPGQ